MKITRIVCLASLSFLSFVACGGSSGDSTNSVSFMGTLDAPEQSPSQRAVSGAEVCALGSCSLTDTNGVWQFNTLDDIFEGGSVLFTISVGSDILTATTPRLSQAVREVLIDISIPGDGTASITQVSQDGVLIDDFEIDDDNSMPEETMEEDLSEDPSTRACELISRANIAIPDVINPIEYSSSTDSCPKALPFLISVANPSNVTFDYELTIDTTGVISVPTTGTLEMGEIDSIEGVFDCSRLDSFNTVINATITNYYPSNGSAPLSRLEALTLCGDQADVGNTIDSVDLIVQVTN